MVEPTLVCRCQFPLTYAITPVGVCCYSDPCQSWTHLLNAAAGVLPDAAARASAQHSRASLLQERDHVLQCPRDQCPAKSFVCETQACPVQSLTVSSAEFFLCRQHDIKATCLPKRESRNQRSRRRALKGRTRRRKGRRARTNLGRRALLFSICYISYCCLEFSLQRRCPQVW